MNACKVQDDYSTVLNLINCQPLNCKICADLPRNCKIDVSDRIANQQLNCKTPLAYLKSIRGGGGTSPFWALHAIFLGFAPFARGVLAGGLPPPRPPGSCGGAPPPRPPPGRLRPPGPSVASNTPVDRQNQPLNCKIRPRPKVVFAINQVKHCTESRRYRAEHSYENAKAHQKSTCTERQGRI